MLHFPLLNMYEMVGSIHIHFILALPLRFLINKIMSLNNVILHTMKNISEINVTYSTLS